MAPPKHILVLNSGIRPYQKSFISEQGDTRLHFRDISRIDDLQKIRGQVFHDVIWVQRLPYGSHDREYIEQAVQLRIMRETDGT